MKYSIPFLLLWLLTIQPAKAKLSDELLNCEVDKKMISLEIYLKFKLQDSIFQKHEGLGFTNLASVKFEVNRNLGWVTLLKISEIISAW